MEEQLNRIFNNAVLKCEQLIDLNIINKYNIELRKENERLCLDDGVTEFDVALDINLEPKRLMGTIINNITILKNSDTNKTI
jgi:hypothetical protein